MKKKIQKKNKKIIPISLCETPGRQSLRTTWPYSARSGSRHGPSVHAGGTRVDCLTEIQIFVAASYSRAIEECVPGTAGDPLSISSPSPVTISRTRGFAPMSIPSDFPERGSEINVYNATTLSLPFLRRVTGLHFFRYERPPQPPDTFYRRRSFWIFQTEASTRGFHSEKPV